MLLSPEKLSTFNVAWPRSFCPKCHTYLYVLQLVPLFSWLALKGRCLHCKKKISLMYPVIEFITALIYFVIALLEPEFFTALLLCLFCSVLLILAVIDFNHFILPDCLTLPLLWSGLLWNSTGNGITSLQHSVWGAALGYISLWATYWSYRLVRKREGLGYGDFKLCAGLGAFLGVESINFILIIAPLLGSAIWLYQRKMNDRGYIAFGPALCGAGVIYLGIQATSSLGYL